MEKKVLGRTVGVEIGGKEILAKVDTGAYRSSIDEDLAKKLNVFDIVGVKKVRTSEGAAERWVAKGKIKIHGKKYRITFTLADRKKMRYPVLLGRRFIKSKFLVDVSKCESQ